MQNTKEKLTILKPITIKRPDSELLDKLDPKQEDTSNKPSLKDKLKKPLKAISWLVETAFRGAAGYIILVDKRPVWATVIVLATGIYMTATSVGLMAYHFIKAYNE